MNARFTWLVGPRWLTQSKPATNGPREEEEYGLALPEEVVPEVVVPQDAPAQEENDEPEGAVEHRLNGMRGIRNAFMRLIRRRSVSFANLSRDEERDEDSLEISENVISLEDDVNDETEEFELHELVNILRP